MKPLDPQISELCRRLKVTDYLRNRGVDLIRSGNRTRCKCPLPTHDDHDPSFYIKTMPDGAEVFKCFGCGASGNIITLMSLMEDKSKSQIVKASAAHLGIILTAKLDVRVDPLPDEVEQNFCEEQDAISDLCQYAVEFMRYNKTSDAINKVSRMYEMLDKMIRVGDAAGIDMYYMLLVKIIEEYKPKKKKIDRRTQ